DGLRSWLAEAAPQGVLDRPKFRFDGPGDYQLSTSFSGLAASAVGHKPGINALSGSIVGDAEAVLISLPEQALQLDFPAVFRTPLRYSALGGDIAVWRDDEGWQVRTDRLVFKGDGYAGELRGGVSFAPDRSTPSLDVAATIRHADLTAAKLFWPITTPPKAMQWLDNAFLGGTLSAQAVFRGNLEDFPFRIDEGRFEAIAELDDMQMRFNPEWPTADHVDATATFLNLGVETEIHGGATAGNRLMSGHVSIEQLNKTVVELQAKVQGRGADLLGYLRATPVGRNAAAGLEGLTIGGRGDIDIKLHIPSGHPELNTVDGIVRMRDAPVASSKWNVQLDDGNGVLHFDQHGFEAKDFSVTHEGNPGSLSLAIGQPVVNDANSLELGLDIPLTVKQLLERVPNVAFLGDTIEGKSDWHIALSIPKADSKQLAQLKLASRLVGTSIELPAPIGKEAATPRSLDIVLPLPAEGHEYRLDYDGVLTHVGRVTRADQPYAARFDLGSKSAGPMPEAGIVIGGRARELDATGWIAFAVGLTGGGSGAGLRSVDVHADALAIGDSRVPDVDVAMSFAGAGTHVDLAGASVQGSVDIPKDLARAGVTVHLPILHWPTPPEKPRPDNDADETRSPFAPSSAPPMHVWVGDLRVGKAEFGETRIETRPTAAGMRIDTLDARSPMFHLSANGDWNGSPANNETSLDLELTAPDLGKVLEGFGFKGLIDGGATEARLNGSWPGSPVAFALSRLSGTLTLDVGKGRFLEVEQGAGGRLFGLLSLGEIRRRLSLDFTDFYKSGTSFNFIRGQFKLDGASATTDDLLIDSPAAQVKITGRTGLKTRDYDQEMTVLPKAGVALPVVGALAGGPVGAAAGLVVQNLFKKQIGAAAASHYKVIGSWEKPEIKLISGKAPSTAGQPESDTSVQDDPAAMKTHEVVPTDEPPTSR
ncbi:MAG: YhdP family protein, partial [Dokdonella sp.]